jgi:hypothetical protein
MFGAAAMLMLVNAQNAQLGRAPNDALDDNVIV